MLTLKVFATLFVALSFVTSLFKNIYILDEEPKPTVVVTLYGWLWRAFVLVVIWII